MLPRRFTETLIDVWGRQLGAPEFFSIPSGSARRDPHLKGFGDASSFSAPCHPSHCRTLRGLQPDGTNGDPGRSVSPGCSADARAHPRPIASLAGPVYQQPETSPGRMLYLQDYDEYFPPCYTIPTPPYLVDPRTSLQPYLKSLSVLYCPERHTVRYGCFDPLADYRPSGRCMGYGYNWGSGLGWGTTADKRDGLILQDPGMAHSSRG